MTPIIGERGRTQIKVAQGAKPGEGGQLPGHKVAEIIARYAFDPGVQLTRRLRITTSIRRDLAR